MTEGITEKEEVRPLPVKQHNHPSEILQLCLLFFRRTEGKGKQYKGKRKQHL